MLILIVLSLAYAQIQDQQQLTNAACVIFSKYYLQSNQELTGRAVGEMIQLQGLTQDDAIMFAIASLVEQCLDSISTQETMDIIQQLQQQKINLEEHKHLVEKADLKKYGSKKKSAKKNEIVKIIKSVDDMINQQKKDYEGGDDGNDQSDGGRKRQRNKGKQQQQELSELSIFELKEWLVLSSFVLVGVLLSYIICCVPERNKKQKKQKNKVKQDDDKSTPKKQGENQSEDEDSPKKVADNEDKQKVE